MGAVTYVARRRLRHHALTLAVAGVVLGIGFGLCFASLAAARRTASAYERILAASDAPDAAVAHRAPPDEAEAALRTIPGVANQRVYAGFIGVADGIERLYSRALLAPTDDEFPLELPNMRAGRLPDPDAVDELFVNGVVADGTGLRVGDDVDFTFVTADFDDQVVASATVVGIGDLPSDAVTDETTLRSIFMFTRAFYEAHRDLTVYSVSNIDLFPGVDPNRELAPAVSELGYELQSARGQEQQSVSDALRPTLVVLVALGVLAFGATAVGAAQVIQRDRDRWRADSATLLAAGMVRRQVRLVQLVTTGVLAVVAVATALMTMVLASPIAPLGPLHDLDPGQGVSFDAAVAALGVVAILVTIGGLALAFSAAPRRAATVPSSSSAAFVNAIGRPASFAGLLLAFRTSRGRGRAWRTVTATAITAAVFALSGAFVASAVALSGTPASYGFDADLLAVNQFGNQSEAELAAAFGNDDVVAATGFTAGTFLLDGQAVPGIAATEIKGEVMPTLVRGESVEDDDEIVVGEDTLARLGAELGDTVSARTVTPGIERTEPVDLRIVGVATFPPVNQAGLDGSRLGNGAVVDARRIRAHGWGSRQRSRVHRRASRRRSVARRRDRGQSRRLPRRGADRDELVHRHEAGGAAPTRRRDAVPRRCARGRVPHRARGAGARAVDARPRAPARSRGLARDGVHDSAARRGDELASDPVHARRARGFADRHRDRADRVHAVRGIARGRRVGLDPVPLPPGAHRRRHRCRTRGDRRERRRRSSLPGGGSPARSLNSFGTLGFLTADVRDGCHHAGA